MDYISVLEATKKWDISERWAQKICQENHIPGVVQFSRLWLILKDAVKPKDGSYKESKTRKGGGYDE